MKIDLKYTGSKSIIVPRLKGKHGGIKLPLRDHAKGGFLKESIIKGIEKTDADDLIRKWPNMFEVCKPKKKEVDENVN